MAPPLLKFQVQCYLLSSLILSTPMTSAESTTIFTHSWSLYDLIAGYNDIVSP